MDIEGERNAAQRHKQYRTPENRPGLVKADGAVMGGVATGRHCRHGMVHGLKQGHAEGPVIAQTHDRQYQVDHDQVL